MGALRWELFGQDNSIVGVGGDGGHIVYNSCHLWAFPPATTCKESAMTFRIFKICTNTSDNYKRNGVCDLGSLLTTIYLVVLSKG